jgi:hypothetical protein
MVSFKIHRLKDQAAAQFRWAPHTSGPATVKQRDYEMIGEVEALGAYSLFNQLRGTPNELRVGDLVELPDGGLRIFKFVGLEEATWFVAPVKPENGAPPQTVEGDCVTNLGA